MDLRQFKESTRPAVNKASIWERTYTRAKYFFYPPTADKRSERMGQYKDLAIFAVAVGVIGYFQEEISRML